MSKRLSILARILEEEAFSKMAQEATPTEGAEIDQATADKVALELYKKIFDAEWQKVLKEIEGSS